MAFSDDLEAGELLAIVVAGGALLYFGNQLYKKLTADANAVVGSPSDWVANGKPLTFPQAQGIAFYIGVEAHGGGFNQSPDKIQIWFYDGSFYDNMTGNYYDKNGMLVGNVRSQIVSTEGCSGVGLACIFLSTCVIKTQNEL